MNVVIVDDEPLARAELRRLLALLPGTTVVGEAANADEAEQLLARVHADALLLDIEMPGASGFDLVERLPRVPPVIFTTAYDHHAVRAFEISALDYLLKPVAPERLAAALVKAAALHRAAPGAAGAPDRVLGRGQRIFVRDGDHCWFVAVEQIMLIESEGNYARLWFDGHRPVVPRSLNAIGDRLDPAMFFRANRRQIINLACIEAIAPWPNDGYLVRLTGGIEIEMSRRQARLFQAAQRF